MSRASGQIRPVSSKRSTRSANERRAKPQCIAMSRWLVTLKSLTGPRANGLTPRAIIETFTTIQMVDNLLPTTDGRDLFLPRHTRPNKEHELFLDRLGMTLTQQPAPRIAALDGTGTAPSARRAVAPIFRSSATQNQWVSILVTLR